MIPRGWHIWNHDGESFHVGWFVIGVDSFFLIPIHIVGNVSKAWRKAKTMGKRAVLHDRAGRILVVLEN